MSPGSAIIFNLWGGKIADELHQIIERVNDRVVDGPPVHDAVHYLGVLQERARQQLFEVNLLVANMCKHTEIKTEIRTKQINFRA